MSIRKIIKKMFTWSMNYKICSGGYRSYLRGKERENCLESFRYAGQGVIICDDVQINMPERVILRDGCYIGSFCIINSKGGFHLGKYSGIGLGSAIVTVEYRYAGANSIPFDETLIVKPVFIENFVWIGVNVSILPGVRIGEGAIIGMGSVVNKDVDSLSIVMGNPARVIGRRNSKHFAEIKAKSNFRSSVETINKLWIPPLTRKKYQDCLEIFGFERSNKELFLKK